MTYKRATQLPSHTRRRFQAGFTLVEILIVVVILGILATIVVPQFSSAAEDARQGAMTAQLGEMRRFIETYKIQHEDRSPTLLVDQWAKMTTRTNISGGAPSGTDRVFGPYVIEAPINPLTGSSTVVALGTAPATTTGWYFDPATGRLYGTTKTGARSDDGVTVLP